jgi:hypothetical protein
MYVRIVSEGKQTAQSSFLTLPIQMYNFYFTLTHSHLRGYSMTAMHTMLDNTEDLLF